MSLITKPNEIKSNPVIKGLIYGVPGIGKTTIALSAPRPLLIDFDKGLSRVKIQHRKDCVVADDYSKLLEVLNDPALSNYDTIVIDTLGKCVDRIADYCAKSNPKVRQADGQLSMKGWGTVKLTFQNLLKLLESKNKSLIFVAHESEEKDGDMTIKRPDCSGSARKDIVKELDFMGYMQAIGDRVYITFNPTDKFYAKNSLDFMSGLAVPKPNGINDWLEKNVFEANFKRIQKEAEEIQFYDKLKESLKDNIGAISNAESMNIYYSDTLGTHDQIWDSKIAEKKMLGEKMKELNLIFDKETKLFIEPEIITTIDDKIISIANVVDSEIAAIRELTEEEKKAINDEEIDLMRAG